MPVDLRPVSIEASRDGERSVSLFVVDQGSRVGRYQVRTNAEGRRNVYFSPMSNGSFAGPEKLAVPSSCAPYADPVVKAMAADLERRGMQAPGIFSEEAMLESIAL